MFKNVQMENRQKKLNTFEGINNNKIDIFNNNNKKGKVTNPRVRFKQFKINILIH